MSLPRIARCQRCGSASKTLSSQSTQRRLFSALSSLQAIGPESPKFIEVPEPIQPPTQPLPPVKGVLPVPRNILPKKKQYKATPEWLDIAAPDPKRTPQRPSYKDRMAEMRRRNMRQGIGELYNRLVVTEEADEQKKEGKILRILKAASAPERHDEQWTRPSVSKNVRDLLAQKDNSRIETEEEKQARKARYESDEKARIDERLNSLHSLYLHARDFIVTEERLEEELEKIFGADDNPALWNDGHTSVWASNSHPPGTSELVGKMPNMSSDRLRGTNYGEMSEIMRRRMLKIAGKLTGGDVPVSDKLDKEIRKADTLDHVIRLPS